jgi:hypothetical protein
MTRGNVDPAKSPPNAAGRPVASPNRKETKLAQTVFEQDLISGRYTILNTIGEALAELKNIEATLKTLAGQHRLNNVPGQGQTLFTLHNSMISLNESYVRALHLSWGNEHEAVKDKSFVDGLQIEISNAHATWTRLLENAYRLRDMGVTGKTTARR